MNEKQIFKRTSAHTRLLTDIQKTQNKMLRILSNTKNGDQISTQTLLSENDMLSVNQLIACIKLNDMWKINNLVNYPINVEKQQQNDNSTTQIYRSID